MQKRDQICFITLIVCICILVVFLFIVVPLMSINKPKHPQIVLFDPSSSSNEATKNDQKWNVIQLNQNDFLLKSTKNGTFLSKDDNDIMILSEYDSDAIQLREKDGLLIDSTTTKVLVFDPSQQILRFVNNDSSKMYRAIYPVYSIE